MADDLFETRSYRERWRPAARGSQQLVQKKMEFNFEKKKTMHW